MANYGLRITPDGSGTWNQGVVSRGATALSGGTAISLNAQDDDAKNSLHEVLPVVLRAWKNQASTGGNPDSAFTALLTDNSNGTYTVTSVKYNATVTGGTTVTAPSALSTTGLNLQTAFSRMARVVKNDKAANG